MANTETALKECLSSIDGATAAALVDYTSGMALGTLGGTVLLAGAAGALWLTRRHQRARAGR